jgi:RHS repeat-associated protein
VWILEFPISVSRSLNPDTYDNVGNLQSVTAPHGVVHDYDAFGNLIHSSGTTPNNYLFAGEQFDPDLNLYYNRARYLNVSTGRFWSMDTQGGDVQAPQSLHKYLYASADPVNRRDPSGNDDIAELSASFAVASTIASMSNVLVAGAYSAAYGSYPDAVAFGVFGAASFNAFDYVGGIVGYEIVFDPRLKEVATFVFGGIEPSVSVSNAPAYLDGKHGLLHKEAGGFVGWYWNLNDLKPGNFGLAGLSFGGGFLGQETTPEGANAMLFGFTTDPDLSVFGIYGGEVRLSDEQSVSEGAMISSIAVAEAAFTALGASRSGGAVSPTGAAVGSLLNAGLGSLWVHYTYGRPR